MRKTFNFFYAFLLALLGFGVTLMAEDITLTTYYPAPYGAYDELTTTGSAYLATTSGNVGIGTTDPGAYKCYVNGTGYLNAVAWSYASDMRLKENINYIQSGLDIVEQLRPVKFDYIQGEKRQAGFIAQEVEVVLPDIITKGQDGMLAMKTDSIIPYLVKAIQEQQKEIDALKAKLDIKE